MTVEENGPQGWFFKIDGEIPVELHDSVKEFVFPCINRPAPRDSLSPYNLSLAEGGVSTEHLSEQKLIADPYNLSLVEDGGIHWTPSKQNLTVDFHPKQRIVVHHILLRWMLANDFNVTKIHGALQFNQKTYMKTFIDTYVSKRSEAKKKGQKEIFNSF